MREKSVDARWPLGAVSLAIVGLMAAGAFLPRPSDPDYLFGVDRYRELGAAAFLAAAGLLVAILFVPGLAGRVGGLLSRVGTLVTARAPRATATVLVVAAAGAVFWFLPSYRLSGDAGMVLLFTATGEVHPSNTLTNYLLHGTARLLSVEPVVAIRIVSTLAGMVYAAACTGLARECFPSGARRVGLAVVLLTVGTVALFCGTIEVYAPFAAAIAVFLLAGVRWLHGKGRWFTPPLVLGVAFTLHGAAGLLLPALVVLAGRGRLFPPAWRRCFLWVGVFLLPVLAVFGALYFGTWAGEPPEPGPRLTGTFLGVSDQAPLLTPVLSPEDPLRRYALFDLEHAIGVANVLLLVALPGLALLAIGRRDRKDPVFRFVAVAALFLVLFPVLWNISYDLKVDWDLFSPVGIPLALLGGLAFFAGRRGAATVVRVGALSLFCLVPFLASNHGLESYRYDYAETVAREMEHAVHRVVSRVAVRDLLDGPGRGLARPADRSPRQWREDLQSFAVVLLDHHVAFRRPDLAEMTGELEGRVAADLERGGLDGTAARPIAGALVESLRAEAGRARARDRDAPPLEILSWNVARWASAQPAARRYLPAVTDPIAREVILADALDEGLERSGAYDLRYRPVDADALRRSARRAFEATFGPSAVEPDPKRWGTLLANALLDVLGPGEADTRWGRLLAAQRVWTDRMRSLRPPGDAPALRRVEWLWKEHGDLPRAERHARRWLDRAPADARWLSLAGGILADRGHGDEARGLLRRAIGANPQNLAARIRLADELEAEDRPADAEAVLARGLRLCRFYPEVPEALYRLARLRLRRGEVDLAAGALRIVLESLSRSAANGAADSLRHRAEALLRRARGIPLG